MIRLPSRSSAVFFVAGVAVLFVSGGVALQVMLGEAGPMAAEWLLLFLPAVVFVRVSGFDLRGSFFLHRPQGMALLAAVLLVVGATPVAWAIGWVQTFFVTVPPEVVSAMEELVTARTPGRMAWLLLALAVTPAICEEAVFRGVLLSSTQELPVWRAVLLNGFVFGAFHLSFEMPIRFLPTAWLGIVIAWAVLRTRSIWVGVLMHFLNNATIVVLASLPSGSRLVTDPDAPPPLWLMALAIPSLWAGVRVLTADSSSDAAWDTSLESEIP